MYLEAYMDLEQFVGGAPFRDPTFGSNGEELTLFLAGPGEDPRDVRKGRVLHIVNGAVEEISVSSPVPIDGVRVLRNGNYLLHSATPRRHSEPLSANTFIYNRASVLLHKFWVGNYAAHLMCDAWDRTWVAYHDQGAGQALAENGLACFNPDGRPAQFFESPGWILDCYAMNVAEDAVWLCYYTDFPVVRVSYTGKVDSWKNPIYGPSSIVARGTRVALLNRFREGPDVLSLLELGPDGVAQLVQQAELPERGFYRMQGRGPYLHAIQDRIWYRLHPFDEHSGLV